MAIPASAFVQPSGHLAKHLWIIWPRTLVFDGAAAQTSLVATQMPYRANRTAGGRFGAGARRGMDDAERRSALER